MASQPDLNAETASGATTSARFQEHRGILVLLAIVVSLHGMTILFAPDRSPFGDELSYIAHAVEDAERGDTSLLPGALRFDWRPEFASRLYSKFISAGIDADDLPRSVGVVHLAMFVALLIFMYLQARWLGLGTVGALVACGLLGLFPWFGFYLHALWPEVIHAFFLGFALCLMQRYLVTWHWAWLLSAGCALGFALLTKGVVNLIVPFLAAYLAGVSMLRFQKMGDPLHVASIKGALPGFALLIGVALVIGPQLARNVADGHGMRLASNRWVNIELGLLRPHDSGQPRKQSGIYAQYRDDENGVGAEEGSRARVLEHLSTHPTSKILLDQSVKWMWLVGRSTSFFERAIESNRWGVESSDWLRALGNLGRGMWYLIFGLGLVGAAMQGLRSPGWGLLALLVLYFVVALFAIPVKLRFAMPMVPVLCFFCGAMADRARDWIHPPG